MMTGDYTKVPLRDDERWTGAPMQQARVLLDHEWNLNLAGPARERADAIVDVVGPAGFPAGSEAFKVLAVTVDGAGNRDLTLGAGHGWVGGLEPLAPAPFAYLDQDQIAPLPSTGTAIVWLDVWEEHVQPAEDPDLVDPALAPVDTAARTRVGWRVRAAVTPATSCQAAMAALGLEGRSAATASIDRVGPAVLPDPCAPPGDPYGLVPNALFRVEVHDAGPPASARLVWSFENGAAAVAIVSTAGADVTLAPSISVKFAVGELVEASSLARRADRLDHGPLYSVLAVTPGAGGDVLTLDRAVPAALASAAGACLRRWDGQVVGASSPTPATLRGTDLGVRFQVQGTSLLPGDWWGSRLRESALEPVELRALAPPDGVPHYFCALGLVDLGALTVLEDCRPTFKPLVDVDGGAGVCTVTVFPGDDLQAAVDSLPAEGGEVCLAAGLFPVRDPVRVTGRHRVVITGVGPASVVRAVGHETAIVFERCQEIEVRHVRVEGGRPRPPGDPQLNGALTVIGSVDVRVADCTLTCPDAGTKAQTCLTVRPLDGKVRPDRVRIDHNELLVGALQIGVLVVDPVAVILQANRVRGVTVARPTRIGTNPVLVRNLAHLLLMAVPHETGATALAEGPAPAPPAGLAKALGPLAERYRAYATPARVKKLGGAAAAARRFVRSIADLPIAELAGRDRGVLARLVGSLQPALQGIVVGGANVGTVEVLDNVVENTIQGIHIGASDARVEGREAVTEVLVSRNVVHVAVPFAHDRERHAIFVGNARSVHVLDTVATLVRPDAPILRGERATRVEAVRVFGVLGPYLVVRHTSARGFDTGVRVSPVPPLPNAKQRLWLVGETVASGGTAGAVVPPAVVSEHNVP
jgi:hypothetical protein